jgi:hypothetical protein
MHHSWLISYFFLASCCICKTCVCNRAVLSCVGVVLDPWDFKLYEQFAAGAVSHSWQLEVGGVSSAANTLPITFGVGLLFPLVPCLTLWLLSISAVHCFLCAEFFILENYKNTMKSNVLRKFFIINLFSFVFRSETIFSKIDFILMG